MSSRSFNRDGWETCLALPDPTHSVLLPPAPVTVVIPCFRCRDTVERAVQSALSQTLPPAEILLVDDASGDGTLELLHRIASDRAPWVKVIPLATNGGPGLARNAGWEAASQPWLAFLDADDAWHPRKLEIQWKWIEAHQDAVLCGHASRLAEGDTNLPVTDAPNTTRLSPVQMLISNRLPTRSVMVRRDLPFRFRAMRRSEDYLLWLEIIFAGCPAYRLDNALAYCFRPEFSPGGTSSELWEHEKCELAALNALHVEGSLSWPALALWATWSYAKFLRRLWLMRRLR